METKNALFFVVGYPRSGTTLLASILGRHSKIFVPPETHFFNRILPFAIKTRGDIIETICNGPRIKDLGLRPMDFQSIDRAALADPAEAFLCALKIAAKLHGKSVIGEKTPWHAMHIDLILKIFPHARIIAIVRDGRDCIISNLEQAWTHDSFRKHAAEWTMVNSAISKSRTNYPERVYGLKYEDLVQNTLAEIERVMTFLNIEFESGQFETDLPSDAVPNWESKWKGKANAEVTSTSIGRWRVEMEHLVQLETTIIMNDELHRLGYDTTVISNLSLKNRIVLYAKDLIYTQLIYTKLKNIAALIRRMSRRGELV